MTTVLKVPKNPMVFFFFKNGGITESICQCHFSNAAGGRTERRRYFICIPNVRISLLSNIICTISILAVFF